MFIILVTITILYAIFAICLWTTWLNIPNSPKSLGIVEGPYITVVIPVRNEASNITRLLDDLSQQAYKSFEVIIADDASTDNTLEIVSRYSLTSSFRLHALPLSDNRVNSPKKRAISESIKIANGVLIVTTDGDCRVGPKWLQAFASCYQAYSPHMITAPVTFISEPRSSIRSIPNSLQIVEFASLIGSGACTLAWNRPTMCNGANLCYEKRVFEDVGGFSGVDHLASGDDELLMHKIARRYPGKVRFLKNSDVIVQTASHATIRGFYQQRKRWASKWRSYQDWGPSIVAIFVFLSNLVPIIALISWIVGLLSTSMFCLIIGIKIVPEFLFLRQVLISLCKSSSIIFIPLTQIVYPFYVVFFGLVAQGRGYEWKGRKLR